MLTELAGQPIKAGYSYNIKVTAVYLNGPTVPSSVTTIVACSQLSLPTNVEWRPRLMSTSQSTFSVAWDLPKVSEVVNGCEITSYRLMSS